MNTPAFDPDDPRLTAYALGESSPAERELMDRLMAASPEARAEVERTASLAHALEAEYRRENEDYWDARQTRPSPGKVVAFPVARRVGPRLSLALVWKIAAVVVALGALFPFALRRAPLARTASLAPPRAVGSNLPAPAAVPPPVEATPAADSLAKATAPVDADINRALAVAPESSAGSTPDAGALLAMETNRARLDDRTAGRADAPQSATVADALVAPKPSARRATAMATPGALAPSVPASASGGGPVPVEDRIGRSLVRIRTSDGSLFGGVLVTADGWILADRPLPFGETRTTVIREDGHELAATVVPDNSDAGLSRVRTDGTALPAVVLATQTPADKAVLIVVSTDRRTGATRFSHAHAAVSQARTRLQWTDDPPNGDEGTFVFSSNGELLCAIGIPPSAKVVSRAKTAGDRVAQIERLVRPFTPAERALLQPPARGASH